MRWAIAWTVFWIVAVSYSIYQLYMGTLPPWFMYGALVFCGVAAITNEWSFYAQKDLDKARNQLIDLYRELLDMEKK